MRVKIDTFHANEPVATLKYDDTEFELSYTLVHLLHGWVASGSHGTFDVHTSGRMCDALLWMLNQMGDAASPVSDESRAFYEGHGIRTTPRALSEYMAFADELAAEPVTR